MAQEELVSKSGMDAGIIREPISEEQLAANRKQDIETYQAQVKDLNSQIADANAILSQLNEACAAREDDLSNLYAKKEEEFNEKTIVLRQQIDQQLASSAALDNEIKNKQSQREAILLDFSNQEHALADQQKSISDQAGVIAAARAQLDADIIAFAKVKEDSKAAAQTVSDHLDKREAAISDRENAAGVQEAKNAEDAKNNALTLDGLVAREQALQDSVQEMETKKQAALLLIAQADDVAKQKAENDITTANIKVQAEQNRQDAAQLRTASIALANRTTALQQREQAVAQAEQKIGG